MSESMKSAGLYTDLPIYERFIGKAERGAADEDSFAGKGKSFPILKPEDVKAAVHAMGRAGQGNYGMAALKARIISIAKKKGWTKQLPKSWQGDEAKESASQPWADIKLLESSSEFCGELRMTEAARTHYPIRIISPGTGTTAHYSAAMLEKAAPKFKAGTLMFWNHPTKSEESARPEGDLDKLAAITTKDGYWDAAGPKGPGIYAEAKPMADYAERVAERAPHIGLSIRAGGQGTGKTVNGLPDLAEITYVESVDYVTKAGRGGIALVEAAKDAGILTEAARAAGQPQENDMDLTEAQKLIEAAVAPFRERALRGDAREEATRLLATVTLPDAAKTKIIESALKQPLPLKEGALDTAKFREVVVAEAKDMGDILAAMLPAGVRGMGVTMPTRLSEADQIAAEERRLKEEKRQRKEAKRLQESATDVFATLMGGNRTAAEKAARGVIQ
jgi:hypothetical protein